MREILFRGKKIADGKWIEGWYFQRKNPYTEDGSPIVHCISDLPPSGAEVDLTTIGQFTGLPDDKNGKKIFEGDIIRHYGLSTDAIHLFDIDIGIVFWDNKYPGYCRTSNKNPGAKYKLSKSCTYEVIGNIYDNPELIEVQK